jgi:hypothetical protein
VPNPERGASNDQMQPSFSAQAIAINGCEIYHETRGAGEST